MTNFIKQKEKAQSNEKGNGAQKTEKRTRTKEQSIKEYLT